MVEAWIVIVATGTIYLWLTGLACLLRASLRRQVARSGWGAFARASVGALMVTIIASGGAILLAIAFPHAMLRAVTEGGILAAFEAGAVIWIVRVLCRRGLPPLPAGLEMAMTAAPNVLWNGGRLMPGRQ